MLLCAQAGLLLSCIVALITTPPPAPNILDYTLPGTYISLWVSFGILLGGLIVGSTDILVMGTSTPQWTYQVSTFVTWNVAPFCWRQNAFFALSIVGD
jgi:hypothetical protein